MVFRARTPIVDPYAEKKCKHCMYKNEPRGCPCWVDPIDGMCEENERGETRPLYGCMYQLLPRMLVHTIKSAGHAAASADTARAETIKSGEMIAGALVKLVSKVVAVPMQQIGVSPQVLIEAPDGKEKIVSGNQS